MKENINILKEIMKKIEEKLNEPQYQHEGEDWKMGLIMAEEIVNEYIQ